MNPCVQEVENEMQTGVTCVEDKMMLQSYFDYAKLGAMDRQQNVVSFFWFQKSIGTNPDSLESTPLSQSYGADAYLLYPEFKKHAVFVSDVE